MTSNDSISMSELKLLLDAHFARTDKQLADFRKDFAEFREQLKDDMNTFKQEMQEEMRTFRAEIRKEINDFKAETRAEIADIKLDIQSFKAETSMRFDALQVQVAALQNDVTGLKHDTANLQTWNYWTLSIILALIAMPQIVSGIKALFGAVSEGISGILSFFRKGDNSR